MTAAEQCGEEVPDDRRDNRRALAMIAVGFDTLIMLLIVATTAKPFAQGSLTIDGVALLTLLGTFTATAVPAAVLALKTRWFKSATLLALLFPVSIVALFLVAMSMID